MQLIKSQKGMTFIEVLVALVILVTGILGAVAMQATAKKGSFDAMQRSVASALAQDILERMRSNDSSALFLNAYNGVYGAAANAVPSVRCDAPASLCTPAQLATNDLFEWELNLMGADVKNGTANAGGLINARGCVAHLNNYVTIVVSWEGREETSDGASGNSVYAKGCGATSKKRRQLVVEAFIF